MIYVENMILSVIIILFPLLVFFVFLGYNQNNDKTQDELMFKLSLFTSAYMIIMKGEFLFPRIAFMSLNIPILIFYIKGYKKEALFLSLVYIVYGTSNFQTAIPIIITEYTCLYCLYKYKEKNNVNDIIFMLEFYTIKSIIYICRVNVEGCFFDDKSQVDQLYFSLPMVLAASILILNLITLGNKMINFHNDYQKILKETNIRLSLFKITHEVKNPLTVCKCYLSILKPEDEKNQKYMNILKREINNAIAILEDFSNFKNLNIEKKYINISKCINELLDSSITIMVDYNISLIRNIESDIYTYVDADRIKQVLINLIKNSIEALEKEKNKQIKIILKQSKKYTTIQVIDNGCGISSQNIKKIGEPFFTTKEKGTGLGVALSKEIIELHNGRINYESNGNGSIATIKIANHI